MRIENQVCTLEQAKRLKELGVKQSSLFFFEWNDHKRLHNLRYVDSPNYKVEEKDYSAFTCAELGVMLPNNYLTLPTTMAVNKERVFHAMDCLAHSLNYVKVKQPITSEAEARAAMLIYLIENNLASVEEINKRLTPDVHATKQSDKETK